MRRPVIAAGLFSAAMVALGLSVGRPGRTGLAVAGGLVAAGSLAWALGRHPRPRELLGARLPRPRTALLLIPSVAAGMALAGWYRAAQGRAPVPGALTAIALGAALIGLAEEVGYRGMVQGCLRRWGWVLAVATASAAHTAYKCSLFVWRPGAGGTAMATLAIGTFVVGALLGLLREKGGGLAGPVAFHVVFDIWAYGDLGQFPWWV
ncbi:MAG: CPBP family intramembrane metalloprotease [Planctomycetes bacterium]|nr:CPBP family intramembrane metalloprotease [Planctomycetota bacterium]